MVSKRLKASSVKRSSLFISTALYFYIMYITNTLSFYPQKIISLVPSITELLAHLQLENETIGITKFCIHPTDWFKQKEKIGGTKNINIAKILSLQPDLIIANKEENVQSQIYELSLHFNVLLTDIKNIADALQMINTIGMLTNRVLQANELVSKIEESFYKIATSKKIKTLYLIWQNPYMTIGGDTFIDSMMQQAGFQNVCNHLTRYPTLTIEEIVALAPEIVLLSSEPFPFKEKHIEPIKKHLPNTKIILADGEMFSWYGNRMLLAAEYFKQLKTLINHNSIYL